MKVNLEAQVALVTGAAQGIGRAVAKKLHAGGARLVIADIDEAAAKEAAAELPGSLALRMDVSSETEVADGVQWIMKQLGRIDILVNNAGINTVNHRVTIEQFPVEEWDRINAVDLRGVFLVSRAVSATMVTQGRGRIVNIASVAGMVPLRLQCAYTAAKAGVINLTRAMAIELAPKGIVVNCVAPGSIQTCMTEKVYYGTNAIMAEQARQLLNHIPAGRSGQVDEVAQCVLFLVDPEVTYVVGHTLCVDGGWTAGGYLRDF